MREFWKWLVPACDRMVDRRAVPCGDFNTGVSGVVAPVDYRFNCGSQFSDLEAHGWRDAYRELHPGGQQSSWWHKGRGFRIDHGMLSRGLAAPNSVAYTAEIAGTRLVQSPSDTAKVAAISDHSALVLDFEPL
jgi:exonuclease III